MSWVPEYRVQALCSEGRERPRRALRLATGFGQNGAVRHGRHYTLEEARAALPWVAERLAAMREAREHLTDADARRTLTDGSAGNGGGSRGKQVGEAFLVLQGGASEFEEREIVLRDLDRGLVDFPSLREGKVVLLCWQLGEGDRVEWWHDLEAGFAGRQPL